MGAVFSPSGGQCQRGVVAALDADPKPAARRSSGIQAELFLIARAVEKTAADRNPIGRAIGHFQAGAALEGRRRDVEAEALHGNARLAEIRFMDLRMRTCIARG